MDDLRYQARRAEEVVDRTDGRRQTGTSLTDNRHAAVSRGALQDNRPRSASHVAAQVRAASSDVVQRAEIPATVTGLTHLVEPKGVSIFEGEEVAQVTHGSKIVIENSDKIRSRRGPNQEHNRAHDLQAAPVYRWVRVVRLNTGLLRQRAYIRDDAIESEHAQPLGARPSHIAEDQRDRSGAMPSQDVHLVGTTHSHLVRDDKSAKIDAPTLAQSDLIVEHPTPIGRSGTVIDRTVQDMTQSALIARAGAAQVIGGDGRKLLVPQGQQGAGLHALSIRSQAQEMQLKPHADTEHIRLLATQFVNTCLGIGDQDIGTVIQNIVAIGTYERTGSNGNIPDVAAVLQNGYLRVSTITKYFKPEVKASLSAKVLAVFGQDLIVAQKDIEEEVNDFKAFSEGKNTEEDLLKYQMGMRDYQEKLANSAIPPFHDAISNLTLFSETLGNNKANLVVAFGAAHVAPLGELLGEVSGIHKNYSIHDKT